MPDFDQPVWLLGLAAALLPWRWHGQHRVDWASVSSLPPDPLSRLVDAALRLLASIAIAAAALSLAGAHRVGAPIERTGTGAHLVILLDRSASMSDTFAGSVARAGEESKGEAAARLLDDFVQQRARDLFGVILFSTAPMRVLGLGDDHGAVRAAISAAGAPGVGLTNIAAGLTMALESFRDQPQTGSRVVLLVSDGAANIEARAQLTIRRLFAEHRAQLYWVFLRTPEGNSPTRLPTPDAGADLAPEFYLDTFFRDLGAPYRLYEADNREALSRAIADVSQLQNLPLRYQEPQPRQDLRVVCDAVALIGALLLLGARLMERPRWSR